MEERIIRGKAVKLGDFVNTDVIAPVRWMRAGLDNLRLHTMEAIRPSFYQDVKPGDIIVAGRNFGCGSHREQATSIMKYLGVSAIIADSLGRIYTRNAIAYGIPSFGIRGVSELVEEGDEIEVVIGKEETSVRNLTRGGTASAPPISDTVAMFLEAGGMYEVLAQQIANET